MTLTELLVVVAIVGLLAVAVLPNIANTAESRRSREAARIVSSFVAKSQSRAVGRREWSGFTLVATNTTSSYAATDMFLSDVPPVYRGDTVPALLAITGSVSASERMATVPAGSSVLALSGSNGANVQVGDQIRFGGFGLWYEISQPMTGTSFTFMPRGFNQGAASATEHVGNEWRTTPWPPLSGPLMSTSTNWLSFEVLRKPTPAGAPTTLTDGRCVDLYWSGFGPSSLTVGSTAFGSSAYRPLAVSGTSTTATAAVSTSVLFDGTGRLRQVICQSGTTTRRATVTGPVYLLVGRADRCGQPPNTLNASDDSVGANWQYQTSYWIAIDPVGGVAKTAPCMPNPVGSTDWDQCVNSQTWIRQELAGEGR